MGGLDDEMFCLVNHRFFAARIPAPKYKNKMRTVGVKVFYDMLGEYFPTFAAMAAGHVRLDG